MLKSMFVLFYFILIMVMKSVVPFTSRVPNFILSFGSSTWSSKTNSFLLSNCLLFAQFILFQRALVGYMFCSRVGVFLKEKWNQWKGTGCVLYLLLSLPSTMAGPPLTVTDQAWEHAVKSYTNSSQRFLGVKWDHHEIIFVLGLHNVHSWRKMSHDLSDLSVVSSAPEVAWFRLRY